MAYDDDWSSFMMGTPNDYGTDMSGFQDQSVDWGNLGGGDQYSNLMGNLDSNYLNFGVSDPYNQYPGGMPTFVGSPNESPFSGMEGAPTESPGGGWMDTLGGLGSKALNWLGSGTNAQDLAGLGLGALGMYGNYRAGQDARDDARGMSQAEINLRRELGLGNLSIQDRGMGLQENQFRLGQGIDDMASKAMGMSLLQNMGKLSADQTNPWLGMMYKGRQQMFENDPVVGQAFSSWDPFGSVSLGTPVAPMGTPVLDRQEGDIAGLYQKMLGREFDQPGMDYWSQSGMSLPQIESAIRQSPEFQKRQMASGGMYAHGGLEQYGLLRGGSTGQADDVNANLSHGEYVFDADVVAALGDGNTEAGAARLDEMRERIRQHKRSAPASKIPPAAKSPLQYLGEV